MIEYRGEETIEEMKGSLSEFHSFVTEVGGRPAVASPHVCRWKMKQFDVTGQ